MSETKSASAFFWLRAFSAPSRSVTVTLYSSFFRPFLEIPEVPEVISPIVVSIPLQLLAYHIAIRKGCNVDMPRNLAKSVTVE